MSGRRTALHEHFRQKRYNHRVIFGQPLRRIRRGWRSRYAVFKSGQVFGYERWLADKYGTQLWTVYVGRTVQAGYFTKVPGIQPGADIWLIAKGRAQVEKLFSALDAMKKAGLEPEDITEHRWRDMQIMLGPNGDPLSLVKSWSC